MNGVYHRIYSPVSSQYRGPAFFLDRDGVLVEETGYLHRPEDLRILDGAAEAVLTLNRAGIPVVVVTNQGGIGLGYYSWSDFEALQEALALKLLEHGARLNAVWACACHPGAAGEFHAENHSHRKPNPGMLLEAATELNLDLSRSWMVGDKPSDIEAGLEAGVRKVFHVLTGYGDQTRHEVKEAFRGHSQVAYCADLRAAVALALGDGYRALENKRP
jgi:D-glycero-D-manno-heptose 1,7-bisphosphate phosphatase